MSDRAFYLLLGLIATGLFTLQVALDHYRTRRRVRRDKQQARFEQASHCRTFIPKQEERVR